MHYKWLALFCFAPPPLRRPPPPPPQLEDVEYALQAAVKARKSTEVELQDVQQQLDDVTRAKAEQESRCVRQLLAGLA